jgi:hypothetical protein
MEEVESFRAKSPATRASASLSYSVREQGKPFSQQLVLRKTMKRPSRETY